MSIIRRPNPIQGTRVATGPTPYNEGGKERVEGINYGPVAFDLIVSVHDSFEEEILTTPIRNLWFPINERGAWPTTALHAAVKTLEAAERAGLKTYVHCASGVNRCRTTAMLWLIASGRERPTDIHERHAYQMGTLGVNAGPNRRALLHAYSQNNIQPELELFLTESLKSTYSTDGMVGVFRTTHPEMLRKLCPQFS